MNKIRSLTFLSFILTVFVSFTNQEHKCILFIGGFSNDDEMEILKGPIKEVIIGDSLSVNDFYHVYFDRKGNMTRANEQLTSIDRDTAIFKSRTVYKSIYNKAGKKTAMTGTFSFHPSGLPYAKSISKWGFNSNGLITRYDMDITYHFRFVNEYLYDSAGRLTLEKIYGKLDFNDLMKFKYNNDNFISEIDHYESDFREKEPSHLVGLTTFEYLKFDSHSNWTTRISHVKHFPTSFRRDTTYTITRKITYY